MIHSPQKKPLSKQSTLAGLFQRRGGLTDHESLSRAQLGPAKRYPPPPVKAQPHPSTCHHHATTPVAGRPRPVPQAGVSKRCAGSATSRPRPSRTRRHWPGTKVAAAVAFGVGPPRKKADLRKELAFRISTTERTAEACPLWGSWRFRAPPPNLCKACHPSPHLCPERPRVSGPHVCLFVPHPQRLIRTRTWTSRTCSARWVGPPPPFPTRIVPLSVTWPPSRRQNSK